MSRPLRIEYEGAWYHVMNRGRARGEIFPESNAYEAFLATVAETVARFRIEVHAYCLMPNHYHLLVRTPHANLSRAMRQIDGLYTQRHNRLVDTDGPLFRGRYKALLIDADDYLLSVSRYIHRNPIEAASPLVDALADWPWSSYPVYIGQVRGPDWLTTAATYAYFGMGRQRKRYQAFVEAGVDEATQRFYERQRQPPILGDRAFREWALERAQADGEVPAHQRRLWHDPAELIEAVARDYQVSVEAMTARGRKAPETAKARARAMWLCREETELTLAAIGERFGGIHYATVNHTIRRLFERTAAADLDDWRRAILQRCGEAG